MTCLQNDSHFVSASGVKFSYFMYLFFIQSLSLQEAALDFQGLL